MNVTSFIKRYADQIDGQFTDYDHNTAVVVMPLGGGRYQAVLATTRNSGVSGKELVIFRSKVCEYIPTIDLQGLLMRNAVMDHSKFIIDDGFLKVEATCHASTANEDQVKEMLQEVAILADEYELTLTGQDIY